MPNAQPPVPLLDLHPQWAEVEPHIRALFDQVFATQTFRFGPIHDQFEAALAGATGRKHAIAISSGTDALLCALMAMDIGPGDEVICPPFTFFATAGSIARLGAKPVFVDICPTCYNLEPALIEAAITPRTRCIIPVHLFGQIADMDPIADIARRHNLRVLEDAAQAIGALHHAKPIGSWSDAAALSFYPTKNLGAAGDAGAILTDNDQLAERIRQLRNHGQADVYHHASIGGNFRLDALQTAVLLAKIPRLQDWNRLRRAAAARYQALMADLPLQLPSEYAYNQHVWHQYTIRVNGGRRDALRQSLTAAGIGCAVFYPLALHLQPCFAYLGYREGSLPVAEQATREVLSLPMFPHITPEQQQHVAKVIRQSALL